MIAIVLSIIFPGLGQFYYGKWGRAVLMLLLGITPLYPVALVWSVIDSYRLSRQGVAPQFTRKEAVGVIVSFLVVAPLCILALVFTTVHTYAWLQDARLNRDSTRHEGAEISAALVAYQGELGRFPENLNDVIGTRPLRAAWRTDGWGRPYRYHLVEGGTSFRLVSAGRDGEFGTADDLEWQP